MKGRRIVGEYPSEFEGDLNIGRGRLIPTTPWDSPFNAVASWMGAETSSELDSILPNRGNFPSLFQSGDLFEET